MSAHQPKSARLASIARQRLGSYAPNSTAGRAMLLIDGERVSSLPSIIESFAKTTWNINEDRDLSSTGKQSRIQAAASSRLGSIAGIARELVALEAAHAKTKSGAVTIPKPDASETLIDLELARHVREAAPIQTKLLMMDERVRTAVARLPVELTGLSAETKAAVTGSLVSPELAVQLGEESEALAAARLVTQAAIDELATAAGWSPRELVQHFGTSWKLPGVTTAGAENIAAKLATEGE